MPVPTPRAMGKASTRKTPGGACTARAVRGSESSAGGHGIDPERLRTARSTSAHEEVVRSPEVHVLLGGLAQ
ncbi:hypothetical protein BD410DRAFT_846527 [Rickenella mellea]|uniref:Uncharacterized protein n=1 Tax=Rickenella mellea TaxID=50990 RepID=A0A4Y7PEW1_9AGAM|nr:hypothetical protein BD410DRAFT_846527 [Rickenella mellea]